MTRAAGSGAGTWCFGAGFITVQKEAACPPGSDAGAAAAPPASAVVRPWTVEVSKQLAPHEAAFHSHPPIRRLR